MKNTQVAISTPFEELRNPGFENIESDLKSCNVQDAIEEATLIKEYAVDPPNPIPGQRWLLVTGTGKPIGILLAITLGEVTYQYSVKTIGGPIIRAEMR